jgi:hypothetical protein
VPTFWMVAAIEIRCAVNYKQREYRCSYRALALQRLTRSCNFPIEVQLDQGQARARPATEALRSG